MQRKCSGRPHLKNIVLEIHYVDGISFNYIEFILASEPWTFDYESYVNTTVLKKTAPDINALKFFYFYLTFYV